MSKHKRLLVRLFVSATAFFFVAAVALGIYFSCALRRIYNDEIYSSLKSSLGSADEYMSSVTSDISDAIDSLVNYGEYVEEFKKAKDYQRYFIAEHLIKAINNITMRHSNIVGLELIIPCGDGMKVISAGDYNTEYLAKYMTAENWHDGYSLVMFPSLKTGNILAVKRPRMESEILVAVEITPIFFPATAKNSNIVITDTKGNVMYSQNMQSSEENAEILASLASGGKSSGIDDSLPGRIIAYQKSLFDGLYIFNIQRARNLDDNLRSVIGTLLLVIAATLIFSVAVAWMLAKLLTKRITDFSKGVKNTDFEKNVGYKTKKTLFSEYKIKSQVIIYHIVACGVPVLLASIVLLVSATDAVADSGRRMFEKYAQQVRESFNICQDKFIKGAKILAIEPDIVSAIDNADASFDKSDYDGASIYNSDGHLIYSPDAVPDKTDIIPQERMYTDSENVYYTASVTRFNLGEYDYSDSIIGYVRVRSDKKRFRERAGILNNGIANVYILDKSDRIILSDVVQSEGQTADDIALYKKYSYTVPINGGRILIVSDVKNNENYRLILETLIFVIILFVLLIVYTVVMSTHFCRPIHRMNRILKEVSDGEFTEISVKTGDEIEELAESFNNMLSKIQGLIKERCDLWEQQRELDYQNKEAQLNILESQINPHFIYNTLESIKWLVLSRDTEKASDMITRLAELFRRCLKKGANEIMLSEELDAVRAYIGIQLVRFEDSLSVSESIDADAGKFKIIRMCLQPLVENAITHGVEPMDGVGKINISVKKEDNNIVIKVIDNGVGMTSERLDEVRAALEKGSDEKGKTGIGMINVNRRVKLLYGEKYGLSVDSEKGKGTCITLTVPAVSNIQGTAEGM